MKLYSLKDSSQEVTFLKAVELGLCKKQGLFFPKKLPFFKKNEIKKILKMNFFKKSYKILNAFIGKEIPKKKLYKIVKKSFSKTIPKIKKIQKNISCLELFHGPTFAFKDFGARFMSQIIFYMNKINKKKITILTATSGDTGAAVAHAFYKMKNIKIVILYPKGKISDIQEKMLCNLGKNIKTISVNGSFDECQKLVKTAFNDSYLKKKISLNSGNSINISRLLAQICYYFEAFSLINKRNRKKIIISVPCGNFGNITAGLIAKSIGLPIKKFIISTNSNDTVPRFLKNKKWEPRNTISTISNAMDISVPNNWDRIEELFKQNKWNINDSNYLNYDSVSEKNTKKSLKELHKLKYISEPHASVAYTVLKKKIKDKEYGLFLGTAHPIKFKNTIEEVLKINIKVPEKIKKYKKNKLFTYSINPEFSILKKILMEK
ncbi:threonine synthase [Buchnera aphidicola (Ceratoglyphina bambusae)]|uniref:threonine synthase n=1 Tax=Buchnera aphidicola TaxID=9 RepID=UPI0031B83461